MVNAAAFCVGAPIFDNELPKFHGNGDLKIKWAVLGGLRTNLWSYKVVPQSFPAKGIDALLSDSPLTNRFSAPVSEPFSLVNISNTCTLRVDPVQGWIKFWNYFAEANLWDKTNHLHEAVRGLPETEQMEKRGLKLLKQFGIGRDDLAQEDGRLITFGEKETRNYTDRRTGQPVEDEVVGRGIFFTRRIDGVNFAGIGLRGGCEIKFGNDAKIASFKLVWRGLKPYKDWKTARPDEMIQFIQNGEAVMTHKALLNQADVKNLTITGCLPLYMGAEDEEKQDVVYPFAQVDAVADLGTNTLDVQFYCPILSTNLIQ
jgi:hypothetical protein